MRSVMLAGILMLGACDGREESALDNLANGANATQVDNSLRAEAQSVMEPLEPPAPGTSGGLPSDLLITHGTIDPKSAEGAARVVEGYYGLLEHKRYDDAQDLWLDDSPEGSQDDAHFALRFRGFSEIHAHIGAPRDPEGAAGSSYVTVPVQVYGRLAANGKPWYRLRQVVLRRMNDVPGSSAAERRWHIASIRPYEPLPQDNEAAGNAAEPDNAVSAADAMVRPRSP